MKLNLKIPIPENANVFAEKGDNTANLMLYEVELLEVLEEIQVGSAQARFLVKDGQFVKKGDTIFTEGFLGHKAMVSDFNGIVEVTASSCRILGQKKHYERTINFKGEVQRVVPGRFIEISCDAHHLKPVYYSSYQNRLTELVYYNSKDDVTREKFMGIERDVTFFINDSLYVDDLARIIALGARRVLVNGIFVNEMSALKREVEKLDGFGVLAGFGEVVAQKITLTSSQYNIFWSKNGILISDEFEKSKNQVYEHPFWGISGSFTKKNELVGNLDYNSEVFEFYLKNIEQV